MCLIIITATFSILIDFLSYIQNTGIIEDLIFIEPFEKNMELDTPIIFKINDSDENRYWGLGKLPSNIYTEYKGEIAKIKYLPTTKCILEIEIYINTVHSPLILYLAPNYSFEEFNRLYNSSNYYINIYSYYFEFWWLILLAISIFLTISVFYKIYREKTNITG